MLLTADAGRPEPFVARLVLDGQEETTDVRMLSAYALLTVRLSAFLASRARAGGAAVKRSVRLVPIRLDTLAHWCDGKAGSGRGGGQRTYGGAGPSGSSPSYSPSESRPREQDSQALSPATRGNV
jgi:hypothetical protein